MRKLTKWILAGLAATALAGCETATPPKLAETAPPPAPVSELPYHWTQGNAPQARTTTRLQRSARCT